jgi:endonuclease YncB( thermonuclease family)
VPRIRIEWMPVQQYGLGRLGFDHLQLVYQPDEAGVPAPQDEWFVMEGVREATHHGTYLGIEGADGRTTLAIANLASRAELTAKIGTPEYRGSRALPYGGDEFSVWETMSSYARDIEAEDFPYIAYGLPGSPMPTINSSSAVASLIHYSGLDPSERLPYGMRLSPGTATLLGTSADDALHVEQGFTTLLGGSGRDTLEGSDAVTGIEKFYGGRGDDLIHWSRGFNIIHGGQPQLAYGDDGTDVIDYSGAGTVTITMNRHWAPHKVPNFVAVFDGGLDYLFSVERIQWNAKTDRIVLGKGVNLIEDDRVQPSVFGGDDRHRPVGLRSASLATADLSMSMPYCRIAAWRRTPRIRPSSPRSRQTSLRATTASLRLSCCPSPTRPHLNRWPHLATSCIGRSDFADNSPMMHAVRGMYSVRCSIPLAPLALVCAAMSAAAQPATPEPCALHAGPQRAVVRVIDAETVLLDDGDEVRLIGALAPRSPDTRPDAQPWRPESEAQAALRALVLGRSVSLAYAGRERDRYGRRLGHLFLEHDGERLWVQGELLSAGHARAYGLPGSFACMRELMAHEAVARTAELGLWANAAYRTRSALRTRELMRRRNSYEIVAGQVAHVVATKARTYVNFGSDWRNDFTAGIDVKVLRANPEWAKTLAALEGQRVEVRGWIEYRNGPFIDVEDPSQIVPKSDALPGRTPPAGGPLMSSDKERPPAPQKEDSPEPTAPGDIDL